MTRYCIDTSALIQPLEKRYPVDVFPTLWERVDELISEGRFVAPDIVLDELGRVSDNASAWGKARRGIFVEMDDRLLREGQAIIRRFPRIVERRKRRSQADPFVVGLAKLDRLVCVTEEEQGSATNVRIPFVCGELSVSCIDFLEMMRREGWRF